MVSSVDHALLKRINLNHLVTFLAVAEESSFRGAAHALNLSQSALSVQIRQLEEALGTSVFERTTRSVNLTPAGLRVHAVALRLANEVAAVARELREEANLQRHRIRLATVPFGAQGLAPAIEEFSARNRQSEVELMVKDNSQAVAETLKKAAADIGILYMAEADPAIEFTEVYRDQFHALVPASEQQLRTMRSITLGKLAEYPFLLQPPGSFVRQVLDIHVKAQSIPLDVRVELRGAEGMVALVNAGLGVAVIPHGTSLFLNLQGCHLLRLEDVPPRPLGVGVPVRKRNSAATQALREFLLQRLGPNLRGLLSAAP